MRQRDANLTALAAIGPRKKRKVDSPGPGSGTEVQWRVGRGLEGDVGRLAGPSRALGLSPESGHPPVCGRPFPRKPTSFMSITRAEFFP